MPDSKLLTFYDESGAPLRTDQVLITKPLANRLAVLRKLDGKPLSQKIDRVADTYVGKYIFMPLADYNAQFGLLEKAASWVYGAQRRWTSCRISSTRTSRSRSPSPLLTP